MKAGALLFTTLLFGCLAGTAQATTTAAKDMQQEVVSYADLNLAGEADAATLLQRIKSAARRVCSYNNAMLIPMEIRSQLQRCADDATARAVANVNARSITVASVRQ
jgi:UrcA family protein